MDVSLLVTIKHINTVKPSTRISSCFPLALHPLTILLVALRACLVEEHCPRDPDERPTLLPTSLRCISNPPSLSFATRTAENQQKSQPPNSIDLLKGSHTKASPTVDRLDFQLTKQPTSNQQSWHQTAMARLSESNSSLSSRNSYYNSPSANVKASCYVVDAVTARLTGFHYSSTGAGGAEWYS